MDGESNLGKVKVIFSPGIYSSVVSVSVTFCVCGITGCRTVVPLTSGVCPLVGETGLRGLGRLPGTRDCCLPTGGWSWALSL